MSTSEGDDEEDADDSDGSDSDGSDGSDDDNSDDDSDSDSDEDSDEDDEDNSGGKPMLCNWSMSLLVTNTGASKKTDGGARIKNADAERDYGRLMESVTRELRTNCGYNTCRCQREDRRRSQKQGQRKGSR
jgi:hypothetical protein